MQIKKIVLATHNPGKAKEIANLLAPMGIDVLSAADLNLPEPEETGTTFTENAVLKAVTAADKAKTPALADDSGLSVTALKGDPGIYSARWGGPEKDFKAAMGMIQDRLGRDPDRSAAFICVLALAMPEGVCEIFEGRVDGTLVWPPRGENGFGYDPMFVPEDEKQTFGEMTIEEKKKFSHRARAFEQLADYLK